MHPNGTTDTAEPSVRPGERVAELPDHLKAAGRDHDFIITEYNRGGWAEYEGRYIAVVDKQLRGHSDRPEELRHAVARDLGVPPGRVAVDYIPCPADFG